MKIRQTLSLRFLYLILGIGIGTIGTSAFPMGRCYVRSCDSSPYQLVTTEMSPGRLCFRVDGKSCIETHDRYSCCANFDNVLNKIVLETQPQCNTSISSVTVNGGNKGGGVFFDLYGGNGLDIADVDVDVRAELRITSLRLNRTQALQTTVCINLRGVCHDPTVFCGGPVCRNAFFDPLGHTCCPTCELDGSSPPNPTFRPSPPSPPSLQNPIFRSPPPKLSPPPTPPVSKPMKCNCTCTSV
jgi:hypothetical protein